MALVKTEVILRLNNRKDLTLIVAIGLAISLNFIRLLRVVITPSVTRC